MQTKTQIKNLIFLTLFSLNTTFLIANAQHIPESQLLNEIQTILQNDYLTPEKLPNNFPQQLSELNQYLEKTQDPYLQYYTPTEAKQLLESLEGKLSGIGAVISFNQHKIPEINYILPNSPAEKAGLQTGDWIAKIDQTPFTSIKDLPQLINSIRGEENSSVELTIYRSGTIFQKSIIRKQIQIPLVQAKKQGESCLVSQLSFDIGSNQAFQKKIQEIGPCKNFIFDLRGNPGGVVEETLKLLDNFINTDKELLRIQTKSETESFLTQKSAFSFSPEHIFIFIDKNTASAAEIFAGTLKHYFPEKTYLIGEKSFGKGTMQQLKELSNQSLLKFTIALRYIANQKNSIDHTGLQPDYHFIDDPATPQDEVLEFLGIKE